MLTSPSCICDGQVAVVAVVVFVLLIVTYFLTLNSRSKRSRSRRSAAAPWWQIWNWRKRPRATEYSASLQDRELEQGDQDHDREMAAPTDPERQGANGVDRNTSVRSVMTLPAYSPVVRDNERILGREGERGGIDTVVEFPETGDEEEDRREEEMESLYQIRLARRNEAHDREGRRQLRRDARARRDQTTLAELRQEAEHAAEESLSTQLIAEHQLKNRDRRVSSVQYGDLGLARHDGTRLRTSSMESDNRPLLDSAASISGQSQQRRGSNNGNLHSHHRGPSASSVLSMSTRASEEFEFPHRSPLGDGSDFEVVSLNPTHSHSRSASGSLATPPVEIPSVAPPTYEGGEVEEAPPYESPAQARAPQLPVLERLPSIHVTSDGGSGTSGQNAARPAEESMQDAR